LLFHKQAGHGKSRAFLDFLQRGGRVDAIIEYEFSASRFKLSIPRESLMILFGLEGIRCPLSKKKDRAAEPYGEEGLDLVRNTLHQREVQIVVRSIDRIGTFLGAMYVNDGEENVAVSLLKNGFALIHEISVGRSPDAKLLESAAKVASDKKVHLHSLSPAILASIGGQKPVDDASRGAKLVPEKPEFIHITPTEVVDGGQFYATFTDASKFEEIGRAVASLTLSSAPHRATEGAVCLAPFGGDGKMYRVKVLSINASAGTADVFYVDFGNKTSTPLRSLQALPVAVSSLPFQAMLFRLAFVRVTPIHEPMGEESAFFLSGRVVETKMLAKVEYREKGSREVFVSLFDTDSRKSIAAELVRNGLARVVDMDEPAFQETVAALREEESKAKHDGVCSCSLTPSCP
jgi:staphylococcal nuclease domain-containing protein 1